MLPVPVRPTFLQPNTYTSKHIPSLPSCVTQSLDILQAALRIYLGTPHHITQVNMSTVITASSEGPVHCQAGGIPLDHVSPSAAQSTLSQLVQELTVLRDLLHVPHISAEISHRLHDPARLPDKETAALAAQAVDLLHETERILQPSHLILADHFLGTHVYLCWMR